MVTMRSVAEVIQEVHLVEWFNEPTHYKHYPIPGLPVIGLTYLYFIRFFLISKG